MLQNGALSQTPQNAWKKPVDTSGIDWAGFDAELD
jgi:hypothetical protein